MAGVFSEYFESDEEKDERPIKIKEYHSRRDNQRPDPVRDNYSRLRNHGSDSSVDDLYGGAGIPEEYDESHSVRSSSESSRSSSPNTAVTYDAETGGMVSGIEMGTEHDECVDVISSSDNSPRIDIESQDITDKDLPFFSRHSVPKSQVDDRINVFRQDIAATLTQTSDSSKSFNSPSTYTYSSFGGSGRPYNNVNRPPAPQGRIVLHQYDQYRSGLGGSGDATSGHTRPAKPASVVLDIEEEPYSSQYQPGKSQLRGYSQRQPRDASPILNQRLGSSQQTTSSQFQPTNARNKNQSSYAPGYSRSAYSQRPDYGDENSLEAQNFSKLTSQTPTSYGSTETGVSTNDQQNKNAEPETSNDKISKHRKRKKKEEINTIRSEEVEGYKGDGDLSDILDFLGEPSAEYPAGKKQTGKMKTASRTKKEKTNGPPTKVVEIKTNDNSKTDNSKRNKILKIQKNNAIESHEDHVLQLEQQVETNNDKQNKSDTSLSFISKINKEHLVQKPNGLVTTPVGNGLPSQPTKSETNFSNGYTVTVRKTNEIPRSKISADNMTLTNSIYNSEVITESKNIKNLSSCKLKPAPKNNIAVSGKQTIGKTVNLSPEDFVTDDQLQDVLKSSTLVNDFQTVTKKQRKGRPTAAITRPRPQTFAGVAASETNFRSELGKNPLPNKNMTHTLKPVKTADNLPTDESTKDKLASNNSATGPQTSVEQPPSMKPLDSEKSNGSNLASRIKKNMAERNETRKEKYDMSETSFPVLSNSTMTSPPHLVENKKSSWATIASKPQDNEPVASVKIPEQVTSCNEDSMSQSSHVSSLTTTSSNDDPEVTPDQKVATDLKNLLSNTNSKPVVNPHPKPTAKRPPEPFQPSKPSHSSTVNQPHDAIHIPEPSNNSTSAQHDIINKVQVTSPPQTKISDDKPAVNTKTEFSKTVSSKEPLEPGNNPALSQITFGTNVPLPVNSKLPGLDKAAPSTKTKKPIIFKDRYMESSRGNLSQLTFGCFDMNTESETVKDSLAVRNEESIETDVYLTLNELRDGFEYNYLDYCRSSSNQLDLIKIVKYLNKEWVNTKISEERHPEKTFRYIEWSVSSPT